MKKFLTVLLALSVVFTYTVGSAFAGTDYSDYYAKVDSAEQQVLSEFKATYDKAKNLLLEEDHELKDTTGTVAYKVTKEAWKVAAEKYYGDMVGKITAETKKIKSNYEDYKGMTSAQIAVTYGLNISYEKDAEKLAKWFVGNDIGAAVYQYSAAREQFKLDKAEQLRRVGLINTVQYDNSIRDIEFKDGTVVNTSYFALAEKAKAELTAAIEAITITDTASIDEVILTDAQLDSAMSKKIMSNKTTPESYSFYKHTITVEGETALTTVVLKTSDELENEELLENATKEQVKSLLAAKSAAIYAANVAYKADKTFDADRFAEAEANREALVTAASYLIEVAGTDSYPKDAPTITELGNMINGFNTTATWDTLIKANAVANIEAIEDLEAYAAKYKAETDAEGYILRDAAAVDAVVMQAKIEAYKNLTVRWDATSAKNAIKNDCYAPSHALEFVKTAKKAQLEEEKAAALENYYDLEQPAVEKAYADAAAKVDAAKTVAEARDVKASLYLIKDKNAVKTTIRSAVVAEVKNLKAYADYLNAGKTNLEEMINIGLVDWEDFYASNGARTADEVKALQAKAKAEVETIKTLKQLSEERLAVEELIAKIPAAVTLEDKATVKTAWDANKKYEDYHGSVKKAYNIGVLNAAIKTLFSLEDATLKAEIAKLPLASKITLADKAAVKEIAAKIDALKELAAAGSEDMYEGCTVTVKIDTYTEQIKKLDAEAVTDAINAIPLNITSANKNIVKAARAAYDAYVAEYTVYAPEAEEHNAVIDIKNRAELFAAEDIVKGLDIKAVESLKITASSVASKGSITVKWKVKGDASAADGFRIYKSTKKNSGFGTKPYFQTKDASKMSYKNTKELKKGTRYYYKVRAFKIVNGKTYFSDYSNKAYRIAK